MPRCRRWVPGCLHRLRQQPRLRYHGALRLLPDHQRGTAHRGRQAPWRHADRPGGDQQGNHGQRRPPDGGEKGREEAPRTAVHAQAAGRGGAATSREWRCHRPTARRSQPPTLPLDPAAGTPTTATGLLARSRSPVHEECLRIDLVMDESHERMRQDSANFPARRARPFFTALGCEPKHVAELGMSNRCIGPVICHHITSIRQAS
mmetsp:Transcript_24145/g.67317  ORF Transcript_24145/g.67317 Transcript_24145/m.67317 type:complete len:205 (-) Transcript_24145:208-822(-)